MVSVIQKIVSVNSTLFQAQPRIPPRLTSHQEPGYIENYDSMTMWYDVFRYESNTIALGPPLMNHWLSVLNGTVYVKKDDETEIRSEFEIRGRNKCYWLSVKESALSLKLVTSEAQYEVPVAPNHSEWFSGRRVLLVKSKNNKLHWIKDWVQHHVEKHQADAVLFYDNHSTDYAADDILKTIASIEGVLTAVVVKWDFPYGVHGDLSNIWDSDYSQYCIQEHARRRFLATARCVLSCDIDELIITQDSTSVFEKCENSESGYLNFTGFWVECCKPGAARETIAHSDHCFRVKNSVCPSKWAVVPSRCPESAQWMIHEVYNMPIRQTPEIHFMHCRGISTSWKYEREVNVQYNAAVHDFI
jgi:hypothetical protein